MNLEERIKSFSYLGEILRNSIEGKNGIYNESINDLIINQEKQNPWFTPANVRMAIKAIADELTFENLSEWTNAYPALNENINPLRVGIIMAGNIPLAGFHDFLSVLISGNNVIVKTSSKDAELIVHLSDILCSVNSDFLNKIKFAESTLSDFDAVIATGSDNSSRYFEYYFARYPNIIRKNRNSVAIIDGSETERQLEDLGTDIFSYFGLGCRNVSKIYLPEGCDLNRMIRNWNRYSDIISNSKYASNYDYNMAIFLVNKEKFLDTGYLLMKECTQLSSPVSVLFYEFYDSKEKLLGQINKLREKIQCVAGLHHIPFGKVQFPKLWDYADDIDTLDFLLKKNMSGIL
jgi:Acyl-CoA reductase (LuxC)